MIRILAVGAVVLVAVAALSVAALDAAFERAFAHPGPTTTPVSLGSETVYLQCFPGLIDNATLSITTEQSPRRVEWEREYAYHTGMTDGVLVSAREDSVALFGHSLSEPAVRHLPPAIHLLEVDHVEFERLRALEGDSALTLVPC